MTSPGRASRFVFALCVLLVLPLPALGSAANICSPCVLAPVSVCVLRFAGSKKSHEVIQFLAAERASESGHVGPAVHDPNEGLVTGEPVSDTGKIRAAMTAVSINHQNFHAIHYCVSAVHTRGATGPLAQRFRIGRSPHRHPPHVPNVIGRVSPSQSPNFIRAAPRLRLR
jgi:hypothetical protein